MGLRLEGPPQAGATATPVGPANTDQTPRTIPGATERYSRAQIANRFGPADWFPGEQASSGALLTCKAATNDGRAWCFMGSQEAL